MTMHMIDLISGEVKTEDNPPQDIKCAGWAENSSMSENGSCVGVTDGANCAYVMLRGYTSPSLKFTPEDKIACVAISADGSCVAVGCQSGQLHFLSVLDATRPI